MLNQDYVRMSAVEIAHAVRSGRLSAMEVVEAALRRNALADDSVRAFREVWPDAARTAAASIDRMRSQLSRSEHPLAGVPVAVKGKRSWQEERLTAAGAVVVGTTATPAPGTGWQTWGRTDRGPTLNPWDPSLAPGGSSAGAAVAVATSMVPLATGSDGAGSIRIPAAWCGVLGLKPTNGLVPVRDRSGLAVGGALASHADDLKLYLSLMTSEPRPVPDRLRVAWSADLGFARTEPEVAAIARAALTALLADGPLLEVETDLELRDPEAAWLALRQGGSEDGLRADNDERLRRIFEITDLIATPTTPNPAHPHEGPGETMSVALTWAFNVSGYPAVSLPAGFTEAGSPVGLQLVAPHHRETWLLEVPSDSKPVEVPGRRPPPP